MKISNRTNERLKAFERSLVLNGGRSVDGPCFAGVDLGTAYIATAVVGSDGEPVAGALTRSRSSIRDGVVLDYVGAIALLREQVATLLSAGVDLQAAVAAYPPGISERSAETFANVVRAAGLEAVGLVDEPSAAALALEISDGAVVDIGGGTTGISILKEGRVEYTADEPTGGTHLDLVLAGHYGIRLDEAERIKTDPQKQQEIFPLVRPVFERMASIVRHHVAGRDVDSLYLVGGTSGFPQIGEVMERETGLRVERPDNPLLVTPLGIALASRARSLQPEAEKR